MWFNITLVYGFVTELALDYDVCCCKAFFDIALGMLNVSGDVALLVCALSEFCRRKVFLNQGGAVYHRLMDVHKWLQNFVVDLD